MAAAEGLVVEDVCARLRPGGRARGRVAHGRGRARITCLLGSNGSGKTTLIRAILGPDAAARRQDQLRGPGPRRPADPSGDRRRHRLHPGGPQGVPQAHGRGEPAGRRATRNARSAVARAGSTRSSSMFPQLRERRAPARRHHVGRRAGHGLDRPRPDARAEAAADRRALARPRRRSTSSRTSPSSGGSATRGVTVFLVEQNVHQTLAIADYGYVLAKGRVVAEGAPRRARRESRGPPGLFRLVLRREQPPRG